MLHGGSSYLHPPRMPDGRVRNITIAGNFIGGVNNDNPFLEVVGQHSGDLTEHGGLADAGTTQQQDALARLNQISNDLYRAKNSPPHAAGKTDDATLTIANRRDTV